MITLVMGLLCHSLQANYSPLQPGKKVEESYSAFSYRSRLDQREVKVKWYLSGSGKMPVVLLSHGLGGNRDTCSYLAKHLASRGFAVVAMQHAGSDTEALSPKKGKFSSRLGSAISPKTFLQRCKDVTATIDQLHQWNQQPGHPLYGKLKMDQLAISGYSYGALTAQATAGQEFPRASWLKTEDKRIKAALLMSPSAREANADAAFAKVKIPWMCLTGTKDTLAMFPTITVESRKQVYASLPKSGNKYQLVLKDANHYAFGNSMKGRKLPRNENHHKVILCLGTAFFEAYLKQDRDAKQWLHSDAVNRILQKGDTWERK